VSVSPSALRRACAAAVEACGSRRRASSDQRRFRRHLSIYYILS
jgi:hypothetical protein